MSSPPLTTAAAAAIAQQHQQQQPSLPSCTDSALSTTSSILGILTFALGLFGFYIALYSSTRNAPADIAHLVSDLRSTQAEINRVSEWIFDGGLDDAVVERMGELRVWKGGDSDGGERGGKEGRRKRANTKVGPGGVVMEANRERPADYSSRDQVLYDEVQTLLRTCIRLFVEADAMLKRSEREGKALWRRVVFLLNRDEVREKVNRLQEQKARLAAIQMSLFLRKSAAQDVMLKRVLVFIAEREPSGEKKQLPDWMSSLNT